MNRPIHFEIHADDPERAIAFYTTLFGWSFNKWEGPMPYWVIKTGDGGIGIDGGLVLRRGPRPADGAPVSACPITMEVPSCDELLQKITDNGGKVALPKMPIPGVGWLGYGIDTEGNIFGVMQADPGAR